MSTSSIVSLLIDGLSWWAAVASAGCDIGLANSCCCFTMVDSSCIMGFVGHSVVVTVRWMLVAFLRFELLKGFERGHRFLLEILLVAARRFVLLLAGGFLH